MAKPAKAATAAKTSAAAAANPDDEIEIDDGTGFTAEEEAALDSARAGSDAGPAAKPDAAAKSKVVTPEQRVAQLEKELAAAKRSTDTERKRAEDAEARKTKANANADAANDAAIANAEARLETDMSSAKEKVAQLNRDLIAAYDGGESAKIAEINDKLLDAKIAVTKLEDNKLGLTQFKDKYAKDREARKKAADAAPPPNADTDVLTDQQIAEVYAGLPKTKEWIDEHPEFKTDIGFRQKAIRAHHAALGAGHDEETDGYFEYINEAMGLTEAAAAEEEAAEEEALSEASVEVRPAAKPAAKPAVKKLTPTTPPSRGATPTQASTGSRFKRLTAAEVEAANDSGMAHEEYYDSKHMEEPEFTAKYGYSNK